MTMNKQRKWLLIALGLAAVGVALDQLLIGPGRPDAAVAEAAPADTPATTARPVTPRAADGDGNGLADAARALERLRALTGHKRDAFAPGPIWLRAEEAADPDAVAIASFETGHRLTSVMLSAADPGAIVNGEFVRIGAEVSGFTLLRVAEREAVFRKGDLIATLHLPTASESKEPVR
ncbi:MAG: hypothetical protein ACF8QF_06075 [Phycisphaerales bacterium]